MKLALRRLIFWLDARWHAYLCPLIERWTEEAS